MSEIEIQKEIPKRFSLQNGFVTYLILALITIIFVLNSIKGGATEAMTLIGHGALLPKKVWEGEYWRLFTSFFVHIGFLHFFVNAYSLYILGRFIEPFIGSFKFLLVYLISGFGGAIASLAFTQGLSAGASGAIFGIAGLTVVLEFKLGRIKSLKNLFDIHRSIFPIIIANLIFGFAVKFVDNFAHLGGLISGVLIAILLDSRTFIRRVLVLALLILCFGLTLYRGILPDSYLWHFEKGNHHFRQGRYLQAITHYQKAILHEKGVYEIYYNLGLSYLNEKRYLAAIPQFKKVVQLTPDQFSAHFNLALCYFYLEDYPNAVISATAANRLEKDPLNLEVKGLSELKLNQCQKAGSTFSQITALKNNDLKLQLRYSLYVAACYKVTSAKAQLNQLKTKSQRLFLELRNSSVLRPAEKKEYEQFLKELD